MTSSASEMSPPISECTVTKPDTPPIAANTLSLADSGTSKRFLVPSNSLMRRCSGVISMTLMRVGVSLLRTTSTPLGNSGSNCNTNFAPFFLITRNSGDPLINSTAIPGELSQYTEGWPTNEIKTRSSKQ